jgi:hypothetical protein
MLKIVYKYLLFCALAALFLSCTNKFSVRYCKGLIPIATRKFEIEGKFENLYVDKANIYLIDSVRNIQKAEEIGIDSIKFNEFLNSMIDDGRDNRKFCSVLYVDTLLFNECVLRSQHIKAVAVYYFAGDRYIFRFFEKGINAFTEIAFLNTETYLVTTTSLNSIAENIVFKNRQGYSLVYIDKYPPYNNYSVKGPELLYDRIEKYLKLRQ